MVVTQQSVVDLGGLLGLTESLKDDLRYFKGGYDIGLHEDPTITTPPTLRNRGGRPVVPRRAARPWQSAGFALKADWIAAGSPAQQQEIAHGQSHDPEGVRARAADPEAEADDEADDDNVEVGVEAQAEAVDDGGLQPTKREQIEDRLRRRGKTG